MKKRLQKLVLAGGGALTVFPLLAGVARAEGEITDITAQTGFFDNIGDVFNTLLSFVLVIAALLVFVYLIWGGIEWVTSGGEKAKTESARNKITAAVIGLVIVAASYAIFTLVLNALNVGSINSLLNNVSGTN